MFLVPAVLMAQGTAPSLPRPKRARAPTANTAPSPPPSPLRAGIRGAGAGTDDQKTVYALASRLPVAGRVRAFAAEMELVKRALADAAAGKPAVDVNEWAPKLQPFGQARAARVAEKQKAASQAYS